MHEFFLKILKFYKLFEDSFAFLLLFFFFLSGGGNAVTLYYICHPELDSYGKKWKFQNISGFSHLKKKNTLLGMHIRYIS